MPLGSAIVNQVAGHVLRRQVGNVAGGLTRVLGNLPGSGTSTSARGRNSSDSRALANQGPESNHLAYPLNVEGDQQQGHYIMFMINQATGVKIAKKAVSGGHPTENRVDVQNKKSNKSKSPKENNFENLKFIDSHLNAGAGTSQKSQMERGAPRGTLTIKRPPTVRLAKAITLYMPPSVKVSYKANYKDDPIGFVASGIAATAATAIDAFGSGGVSMDSAKKTAKSAGEGVVLFALDKAKLIADTFAPGASTLAQLKMGAILGSKMELMFTNMDRRTFNYTFNFIPKSEKEAQEVQKIVQTFKEHMLPEYLQQATIAGATVDLKQGRILKIPNTFDIHYFYHETENPFLNRISTCYLSQMDVDYGGDKYTVYEPTKDRRGNEGTPPQRTNISLTFNEIEIITRERATDGF
jgi:hypothetical protein